MDVNQLQQKTGLESSQEFDAGFSASSLQIDIWNFQQGHAHSARHLCLFKVIGTYQLAELKSRTKALIAAHEILRTRLIKSHLIDYPVQVIDDESNADRFFKITEHTVSGELGENAAKKAYSEKLEFLTSYSPEKLDIHLFPSSDGVTWGILSIPAIISDRATLQQILLFIFSRSTSPAYRKVQSTFESEGSTIQYADLSDWLSETLGDNASALSKDSSGSKFSSAKTKLATIDSIVFADLRRIAEELSTEMDLVLSRVWALFLWNYDRGDSIVVGEKTDFRNQHVSLQRALGPMDSIRKVALEVREGMTFKDFIIQSSSLSSSKVLPKNIDLFEFRRLDDLNSFIDSGVTIINLDLEEGYFRFKLEIEALPHGLTLQLKFDSAQIAYETAEELTSNFLYYMQQLSMHQNAIIDEISPLSPRQQGDAISVHNATQVSLDGANLRLETLFEHQARKSMNEVALVYNGDMLSYIELNQAANRLARHLKKLGIQQGDRVVIISEPSFDYVIQVLASMKSGASFVPIDTEFPARRINSILEQLNPKAILTQDKLLDQITQKFKQENMVVTTLSQLEFSLEASENLNESLSINAEAYTIYTSGTTGKPKGVSISQFSLVNFTLWMKSEFTLGRNSKVLQMCSHAFDVSIRELFWPLISGATVFLTKPEIRRSPEGILSYIDSQRITDVRLVPILLNAVIDAKGQRQLSSLERIFTGGEALTYALEKKYHENFRTPLFNMYGPTETTVNATYRTCTSNTLRSEISIGKPIANTQIYILNDCLKPVPIGARGEIFISGAGVAMGYLGEPELSQSKFLPDPFMGHQQKMYRTGDYGRYLESGEVQFLGRIDHQVKLRGYRVELSEVESVLSEIPNIKNVVVQVVKHQPDSDELVAFIIGDHTFDDNGLRTFCLDRLPLYMIPSRFIKIPKAVPLTLNGKVDFKALAQLSTQKDSQESEPETELESLVISIWKKILATTSISSTDNYFNLGGDSIRTIQVVQDLARFGFRIDPMDIFKNPTPQLLARRLAKKDDSRPKQIDLGPTSLPGEILELIPSHIIYDSAFPTSAMQEIILKKYADGATGAGVYHVQQVFNLKDPNGVDISSVKRALISVLKGQKAFRTRFLKTPGDSMIQIVLQDDGLSLKEIDLQKLPESSHSKVIEEELARDRNNLFQIEDLSAPLCRFYLFVKSRYEVSLSRTTHHAITDGWGKSVFFGSIAAAYVSLKNGVETSSKEETDTYKEFIALELEAANDKEAEQFWSTRLSGISDNFLELRKNPMIKDPTKNLVQSLEPKLCKDIKALASKHLVSIKSIYLTAFYDVISAMIPQKMVHLGVVSNGRSYRLTNPLTTVGLFWNIVPFRPSQTSESASERVRATQVDLISIEQYSNFPLKKMSKMIANDSLFFATFNFVHFHSVADQQFDAISWSLSNLHDKFHYPLNLVVSVHPLTEEVTIRIEFDQRFISEETIISTHAEFLARLTELVKELAGAK